MKISKKLPIWVRVFLAVVGVFSMMYSDSMQLRLIGVGVVMLSLTRLFKSKIVNVIVYTLCISALLLSAIASFYPFGQA